MPSQASIAEQVEDISVAKSDPPTKHTPVPSSVWRFNRGDSALGIQPWGSNLGDPTRCRPVTAADEKSPPPAPQSQPSRREEWCDRATPEPSPPGETDRFPPRPSRPPAQSPVPPLDPTREK